MSNTQAARVLAKLRSNLTLAINEVLTEADLDALEDALGDEPLPHERVKLAPQPTRVTTFGCVKPGEFFITQDDLPAEDDDDDVADREWLKYVSIFLRLPQDHDSGEEYVEYHTHTCDFASFEFAQDDPVCVFAAGDVAAVCRQRADKSIETHTQLIAQVQAARDELPND